MGNKACPMRGLHLARIARTRFPRIGVLLRLLFLGCWVRSIQGSYNRLIPSGCQLTTRLVAPLRPQGCDRKATGYMRIRLETQRNWCHRARKCKNLSQLTAKIITRPHYGRAAGRMSNGNVQTLQFPARRSKPISIACFPPSSPAV